MRGKESPSMALSPDQVAELLESIRDAEIELELQRRRTVERAGPTAAESLDLGRTIERLRKQAALLETVKVEVAKVEEPQSTPARAEPSPVAEEEEWPVDTKPLEQFYVYYWFVISKDQLNFWIYFQDSRLPTKAEASVMVERAIKQLGGGYWQMLQDWTVPNNMGVLYRDGEFLDWGWDNGVQAQPVQLRPGEDMVRKLKIEDWLEHPEAQRPKEISVRSQLIRGR